jgi:hypothetical protein
VLLSGTEYKRHQVLLVGRSQVHFSAETSLTSPQGFGLGPSGRTRGMLMSPNDGAIDIVNVPVESALGIRLLLDILKEMLPNTSFLPAIEAARHGAPTPIAPGQIAPWGAGAQNPQDTIEDASMI